MNGPQDMGGFTRFGPVNPETDEPVFHSHWERRLFAVALATGATGSWNIDISRHTRESLPAHVYWSSSYYEIWLRGLVKLTTELGLITGEELAAGHMLVQPLPVKRVLAAGEVASAMAKTSSYIRPLDRPARFKPGDLVRTRVLTREGHTRLPRYAMGRLGEIVAVHGAHVFPDASAHGKGEDPHWLYGVRFSARELWGKDTPDSVCLDLWEPYLEPA
ncbi:MAG: nitrile hydratase subunit beta [Rhizobiales bacterium]|nr:nitrile hydratase subunit beta [Hyphomicrobiales bacterium]MBI3671854.1 nitrile hydratase subunit beta [Hyphomicrobiales bacterium]